MTPSPADAARHRGRWILVALFLLFFGSVAAAGILRFSGWMPAGQRNYGELLRPPGDLRGLAPRLASGGAYPWLQPKRIWRIVVVAPDGCAQACVKLARDLDTVWQLFGHRADRVHILWIGNVPPGMPQGPALRVLQADASLLAALPGHEASAAGVPVFVADPNGFLVLRYAPGFDPAGLRRDVAKLLQLM